MAPRSNRVKVRKNLYGLAIETNNFAFEVNVISGLESTHPDDYEAKIGKMVPRSNRVKVWKNVYGLAIKNNNFAFEVNVISGLENTHPDG